MSAYPALDVKPPQTDWLGEAGKLVSLKALMQAAPVEQAQREENLRTSKAENKRLEYAMGATKALNESYKNAVKVDANGIPSFDTNELSKSLSEAGYGSEVPGVLKGITDFNKSNADLREARQKIETSSRDSMGAAAYAIKKSNYDPGLTDAVLQHAMQDPSVGDQQKQQLAQLRQMLQNPQGKEMLPKLIDSLISQSPKYQELSTSEKREQNSEETLKLENKKFDATMPGGPLEDVSKTELRDYLKNPAVDRGTPISERDGATFAAWKAKLNPLAQISVANTAGGGRLSDEAMDNAAEIYWQTGKLPPTARGLIGLAQNKQVMNRAAKLHAGEDITSDQGAYKANQKALSDVQDQYSKVEAFSNTAGKNLDLFVQQAKKVIDSKSPFVNKPLRSLTKTMVGGSMVPYDTARTVALTEIGRVLNSANAAGVVSDSARHEVEGLIGRDATLQNVYDAAAVLKQDMANRKSSYAEQIADLQRRMGSKKTKQEPAKPAASAPSWDKYPEVK